MKIEICLNMLAIMMTIIFLGCSKNSNDDSPNNVTEQRKNRLSWESIPSQYNPRIIEEQFNTNNINRIYMDMFSFKEDVEVIYLDSLAPGQGYLKIFSVLKESGSSGNFKETINGQNLQLNRYGTYQCSINIENRNITQLKGLCFVRLQIFLPTGSEIEVYNVKQLISKRFIPVDAETFIKNFKEARFSDGRKSVINDYISSYSGMNKSPQLLASQLGIVIHDCSFKEEKFEALRKLHIYITDRHNLNSMIEREIGYFEQDEAKSICGL
jgi:hypothetical protein